MATTGTFAFNPATSGLMLSAFARIGIRRTQVTSEHMADADVESNLVQVDMANRQPNLWTDELYEIPLIQGTATYALPARMIAIQAAYISIDSNGVTTDRILWPLSTFEYASLPDKTTQAPPTSYWYNRQITPEITLWQVPDHTDTYTLKLRILHQIEDASLVGGTTLEMPYRFLDVFVAKLAHRLARIYAPDKEALRKADADEAWMVAATQDQEDVPMYIAPGLNGYYR